MICLSLSWYQLTRPVRRRRAVRRYERHLRALRHDTIPYLRADRLDLLAMIAGTVSGLEHRDRETVSWGNTARFLRAVAASERFDVLTAALFLEPDPDGTPAILTAGYEYRSQWELLARAGWDGDRRERARLLAQLAEAAIDVPGVLVLDDIAETELAIAGDRPAVPASGIASADGAQP